MLNCGELPKFLEKFTDEARQCFAFQQYNAVFSLCRTMLELTIKELSINNGILPKESHKIKQLENYKTSLIHLIDELSKLTKYKSLYSRLHWVRKKANFVVHGNKTANEKEAQEILKETFTTITLLFEKK